MLSDEREISNLCHRYATLLDHGDHDGLGRLFEHGELEIYTGSDLNSTSSAMDPLAGAHQIRAFYDRVHEPTCPERHVITNVILTIDASGQSAAIQSYFQGVRLTGGGQIEITAIGRYHDTFRRVDGRWRFAKKIIYGDYLSSMLERSLHQAFGTAAE